MPHVIDNSGVVSEDIVGILIKDRSGRPESCSVASSQMSVADTEAPAQRDTERLLNIDKD